MRRAAIALAVCLSLAAPAVAAAATCPRTSLGDVEDEVMCLECGVPLDVAEGSGQAQRERAFIVRQIAGLLLAGTLVGLAALRWRRRRPRPAAPSPTEGPDARESARLDADIGRYEL